MSSFFDIDEEDFKEKDNVGTTLASAANVAISGSVKVDLMSAIVTPLTIIIAEEKVGSSKPMLAEIRVRGPKKLKRPRKLSKMTRHLMRGLLVKNWGSKIYNSSHN